MGLSDEDRRRIYEEEKARMEARERIESEKGTGGGSSTTSLKPNTAGLLCYLGMWVTGIIFLIIEKKNRFVRFHAMQSMVVFGILQIIIAIADGIRAGLTWTWWAGYLSPEWITATVILRVFQVLMFILWVVLMYQAHNDRLFKIPLLGDLAELALNKLDGTTTGEAEKKEEPTETAAVKEPEEKPKEKEKRKDFFEETHTGRIVGSAAAIVWSSLFLVFFNFFSRYLAYYERETVNGVTQWQAYPLLTADFGQALPAITIALIAAIVGNVILLILDNYYVRQIVLGVLNIFALAAVLVFFFIFPLDFSVIPNTSLVPVLDVAVRTVLILVAIGIAIGTIVRFVKLATGRR